MILKNLYNVLEQGVLKKIMLNKLDLKVKKKTGKRKIWMQVHLSKYHSIKEINAIAVQIGNLF